MGADALAAAVFTVALVVGAGAYLILTLIGFMYHVWLFREFKVNVLDFSEAGDFLRVTVDGDARPTCSPISRHRFRSASSPR